MKHRGDIVSEGSVELPGNSDNVLRFVAMRPLKEAGFRKIRIPLQRTNACVLAVPKI